MKKKKPARKPPVLSKKKAKKSKSIYNKTSEERLIDELLKVWDKDGHYEGAF